MNTLIMICVVIVGVIAIAHHFSNKTVPVETNVSGEILDTFSGQFDGFEAFGVGQELPAFTFVDRNMKPKTLNDYKGQYVLVNFWATWCPPCVVELPSLKKLDDAYDNLTVLPISTDFADSIDDIVDFLNKKDIDIFAANWDNKNEAERAISMRGLPNSYLITPNGQLLYQFEGDADWMDDRARAFFNALLTEI